MFQLDGILEKLAKLHGSWKGKGKGKFPTIDSFEYEEHLHFEVDLSYPLIHYEQKTVLLPSEEPSHWESGFIRVLDSGMIEISNSQDSGRVEVLQGTMKNLSNISLEYEMEFVSIVLANDSRLVNTRRVIKVTNNTLEYSKFMATNTTEKPMMLPHLHSILTKVE